jgi:hypothetical protein
MKIPHLLAFFCLSLAALSAQEAPKPSVSKAPFVEAASAMFDKLEAYNSILEGVKDKATAQSARTKVEKLTAEFKTTVAKAKALGDPPENVRKEIESDTTMKERATQILTKMNTVTRQLAANQELLAIVRPALVEFQQTFRSSQEKAGANATKEAKPATPPTPTAKPAAPATPPAKTTPPGASK